MTDDLAEGVPEAIVVAVRAYVERGEAPGPFVRAVLADRFFDACGLVGPNNRDHLVAISKFVFNACPGRARGSYANVDHWVGHNGLAGEPKHENASSR